MKKRKKTVKPEQAEIRATPDIVDRPTKKKPRKMLYFLLGFLLVLVYVVGCHADSLAKNFLFHPPKYPSGHWDSLQRGFEEVRFRNSRNETLIGHYYAAGENAGGSILYCHGNGENISYLDGLAKQLREDLNCNVLVFDYAGYGKSEGGPTAVGILDDSRAARDHLAQLAGIPASEIIVYGQSLGGSVAVDIAAKDGARALIVESSFTSLGDMGRRMFPFLPVNWLLRERLASVEKIGDFHGPVFVSHGEADEVVPFSQGKRLFAAANEPKTFYVPPKDLAYHSAPHGEPHRRELRKFVDSLSTERPASE